MYSWYPRRIKKYFERLAVTTRPELVNFAKYPAVNWFSFYSLRVYLAQRGLSSMDRFDVMDLSKKDVGVKILAKCLKIVPPLRWLAHVATPGSMVVAMKHCNG
jgi:2-polyprenyl-6-hydroxyphenyl methylase/3-demethylubiquinone-9 3-methyltransferase